jgi:hypothetical protein
LGPSAPGSPHELGLFIKGVARRPPATTGGGTGASPYNWLQLVNIYRRAYGVPSVTEDPALTAADAVHMRYMLITGLRGHYEDPANPNYTSQGDEAAKHSNLFYGSGSGVNLPDADWITGWMTAPFHELGILRPRLQRAGFASGGQASPPRTAAALDVGSALGPVPDLPTCVLVESMFAMPDPTQTTFTEQQLNDARSRMSLSPNHSVVVFGATPLLRGHDYVLDVTPSDRPAVHIPFHVAGTRVAPVPAQAPVVTRVTPAVARTRGGTVLTITGRGLSWTTAVTIGGTDARIRSTSAPSRMRKP